MLNFENDVQDFIERTWKDTVCDGFTQYKTYWETWVGTRPSEHMALTGYELSFSEPLPGVDRVSHYCLSTMLTPIEEL